MKVTIVILILILGLNGFAETTQTRGGRGASKRHKRLQDSVAQCVELEKGYQKFVSGNIDAGWKSLNTTYQCLVDAPVSGVYCNELVRNQVHILKQYREMTAKLYQEAALAWVKEKDQSNTQGMNSQCFLSSQGTVEFEEHLRNVKIQTSNSTLCSGVKNAWASDRDRWVADYMDGRRVSTSLSSAQLSQFAKIHRSPTMKILSDQAKWKKNVSDRELQSALASAFNSIQHGVGKLNKEISAYEDSNRYNLYVFDGQLQKYLNTLDPEKQQKMKSCAEDSGVGRDCFSSARSKGRCLSMFKGFAREVLPFVSIADDLAEFNQAKLAQNAGIIDSEESAALQTAALTQATFGVVGAVAASGKLASVAAKKIGNKFSKTFVSRVSNLSHDEIKRLIGKPTAKMSALEREALLEYTMSKSITDSERLALGAQAIGLSTRKKLNGKFGVGRAILEAHRACQTKDIGCLRKKMRILSAAGLNRKQIQALMDRGIAGQRDEKVALNAAQTFQGFTADGYYSKGLQAEVAGNPRVASNDFRLSGELKLNEGDIANAIKAYQKASQEYLKAWKQNRGRSSFDEVSLRDDAIRSHILSGEFRNGFENGLVSKETARDVMTEIQNNLRAYQGIYNQSKGLDFQILQYMRARRQMARKYPDLISEKESEKFYEEMFKFEDQMRSRHGRGWDLRNGL